MAKYIDAELLINDGWQLQRYNSGDGYVNQEYASIKDIPPADVRPVVRGKWVPEPDRHYHWHCSECGYTVGVIRMDCKFCPNCGTDMREGDADG